MRDPPALTGREFAGGAPRRGPPLLAAREGGKELTEWLIGWIEFARACLETLVRKQGLGHSMLQVSVSLSFCFLFLFSLSLSLSFSLSLSLVVVVVVVAVVAVVVFQNWPS